MDLGAIIIMGMFAIVLAAFIFVVTREWVKAHRENKEHKAWEKEDLRRRLMEEHKESEKIMTEGWLNAILQDAEEKCRR